MEIAVSVDPFTVKHIFYLFLCLGSLKAHLWEMETVVDCFYHNIKTRIINLHTPPDTPTKVRMFLKNYMNYNGWILYHLMWRF